MNFRKIALLGVFVFCMFFLRLPAGRNRLEP